MAAITICLPDAALERAKAIAASAGRPLDDVIRDIVVEGVDARARVLDGINAGIADADAGRVVDVDHVSARIDDVLRKLQR